VFTQVKYWNPFIGPFDPCPPIRVKSYQTPPNLYIGFQPPNMEQYSSPRQALYCGTLWPAFFSPYPSDGREEE